jgi:hypothetical protein
VPSEELESAPASLPRSSRPTVVAHSIGVIVIASSSLAKGVKSLTQYLRAARGPLGGPTRSVSPVIVAQGVRPSIRIVWDRSAILERETDPTARSLLPQSRGLRAAVRRYRAVAQTARVHAPRPMASGVRVVLAVVALATRLQRTHDHF